MRLIDADEAKKQISQMQTLKASERNLLRLALDRTTMYELPNDPLTLEGLREMDGEPVWIQHLGENKDSRWRIIKYSTDAGLHVEDSYPALYYGWDTYGWLWNAYRRKPEEGTT